MAAIFADDIFICIFSNENFWISNKILLPYVRQVPIDNKPLSEPMIIQFTDAYTPNCVKAG